MSVNGLLDREKFARVTHTRHRPSLRKRVTTLLLDVAEYVLYWEPPSYRLDFGRGRHAMTW